MGLLHDGSLKFMKLSWYVGDKTQEYCATGWQTAQAQTGRKQGSEECLGQMEDCLLFCEGSLDSGRH